MKNKILVIPCTILFLILTGITFITCSAKKPAIEDKFNTECCAELNNVHSRLMHVDSELVAMKILNHKIDSAHKVVLGKYVRLKHADDSLRISLGIANGRLVRIQTYVNICKKKPSQKAFFFGWIDRALTE